MVQALARHRKDSQFSAIGPYAYELLELIMSMVQISVPPNLQLPGLPLRIGFNPPERHPSLPIAQESNNEEPVADIVPPVQDASVGHDAITIGESNLQEGGACR